MREIQLSAFGLMTVEQAAQRRGVAARTVQRWIEIDAIPVVIVGEGRNRKFIVREVDVDAYQPPPVGAPKGNANAAKKEPKKGKPRSGAKGK